MEGTSNKYLEMGAEVIVVPPRDQVQSLQGPEEYMQRLNSLEEPSERLKTLLVTLIDPTADPTHEALWIRKMALVGATSGLLVGGILKNKAAHLDYQRKHNASIFDNKFVGNRHFYDTLVYSAITKGFRTGVQTFLWTTAASTLTFGSIAYRNELFAPDLLIGFTALGAISRLWLGSKGVLAGGAIGLAGGCIVYGFGKILELTSGQSVTQFRLHHHSEWLRKREARFRRLQQQAHELHDSVRTSLE